MNEKQLAVLRQVAENQAALREKVRGLLDIPTRACGGVPRA